MAKHEKMDVKLEPNAWHGQGWEGLWVEHITDDIYRVDNIPFYAHGISSEDDVVAHRIDGRLLFKKVYRRGGHSTYRLLVQSGSDKVPNIDAIESAIKKFGCSFEGLDKRLYAIDVPPGADIHSLYRWLDDGETRGYWIFEEGHYETLP